MYRLEFDLAKWLANDTKEIAPILRHELPERC